ncbi:hypothetical protein HZS_6084 [Henneguya salminicola]|nr:hypothetical protein HZS_6084 [Henneguya salminicola]
MCDFELASINSFNQQNPICELTGTLYFNDHLFRKNIKMFLSHAFCLTGSVQHCFELFKNYLIQKGQMGQIIEIIEIFKYFEDNFIGRFHRMIRQHPLFAINIWNQFARIMGNAPRTNNVPSLTDVKIDNTPMRPQNETNQRTCFLNKWIRALAARFNKMTPITFLENMANLIII